MTNKQFFSKIDEFMQNGFCDDSICLECKNFKAERVFYDKDFHCYPPASIWCDVDSYQFGFPDGCSSFEQHERRED